MVGMVRRIMGHAGQTNGRLPIDEQSSPYCNYMWYIRLSGNCCWTKVYERSQTHEHKIVSDHIQRMYGHTQRIYGRPGENENAH